MAGWPSITETAKGLRIISTRMDDLGHEPRPLTTDHPVTNAHVMAYAGL